MDVFLHRLPLFFDQHALLVLACAGLLLALLVTEVMQLRRGWNEATPATVTRLLNRDNALLIDLSPRADFEKGHIPGARNVAMEQFDPEHKDLAKVKDMPIIVCCRSGVTSQRAAQKLVKAGFKNVHSLAGGLAAWRQADLPVVKGKA
jgi:rhodanese-related sulfurtransferase